MHKACQSTSLMGVALLCKLQHAQCSQRVGLMHDRQRLAKTYQSCRMDDNRAAHPYLVASIRRQAKVLRADIPGHCHNPLRGEPLKACLAPQHFSVEVKDLGGQDLPEAGLRPSAVSFTEEYKNPAGQSHAATQELCKDRLAHVACGTCEQHRLALPEGHLPWTRRQFGHRLTCIKELLQPSAAEARMWIAADAEGAPLRGCFNARGLVQRWSATLRPCPCTECVEKVGPSCVQRIMVCRIEGKSDACFGPCVRPCHPVTALRHKVDCYRIRGEASLVLVRPDPLHPSSDHVIIGAQRETVV
mmetsp:Transcript_138586/g.276280  ORF Transcript_138586/g.276280 Transcript_138586/m.276280 type:complete len:302 (+) Transcript_138586:1687-2592(+)